MGGSPRCSTSPTSGRARSTSPSSSRRLSITAVTMGPRAAPFPGLALRAPRRQLGRMRTTLLAALASCLAACASTLNTPLSDIPKLTKLDQVMDNQATAIDPQFKKIGQASFTDAELTEIAQAAERLQATSLKIKDF